MARLENGIVYKFSNLTGLSALLMPKMGSFAIAIISLCPIYRQSYSNSHYETNFGVCSP